jgi:hypothetical protein
MSLTAQRPSKRGADTGAAAHVEKARAAVSSDQPEKKIPLLAPPHYHQGLQDIKNLTVESTPVKYLLLEAIDDLFEKYKSGEGKFKVDDLEELRRRLDRLGK